MQNQTLCIIHAVPGVYVGNAKFPVSAEIQGNKHETCFLLIIYARILNVVVARLFLLHFISPFKLHQPCAALIHIGLLERAYNKTRRIFHFWNSFTFFVN